jgi:hypothetical protein
MEVSMAEFYANYRDTIVIGLTILCGLILALVAFRAMNRRISGDKGQRLGVTDHFSIDKDRKIVLIRRDDVEHLVMIGGPQDLVIEPNIGTGLNNARPSYEGPSIQLAPSPSISPGSNVQPLPLRVAPRPPVFGASRPPLRPVEAQDAERN